MCVCVYTTVKSSACIIHMSLPRILYLIAYVILFYLILSTFYKLQIMLFRHSMSFTLFVHFTFKG